MHNIILEIFTFLKNFIYFIKVLAVFLMMTLILYWVNNTANFNWSWLDIISPTLDTTLALGHKICPISFEVWGTTFELKYVSALFLLLAAALLTELLSVGVDAIKNIYLSSRFLLRRNEEKIVNEGLKNDMIRRQKSMTKYFVVINTYEKERSVYQQQTNIDMNEQNNIMNKFIIEKTDVQPKHFEGGFLYEFNNFEKIDQVLETLFKVVNSKAPINYTVCIQIGTGTPRIDKDLLKTLIKLKYLGKIYMGSDTTYRYSYNSHRHYETSQIGLYQDGERGTMEVHEFKNPL